MCTCIYDICAYCARHEHCIQKASRYDWRVSDCASDDPGDSDASYGASEKEIPNLDPVEGDVDNSTEMSEKCKMDREMECFNECSTKSEEMLAGGLQTFEVTYSVWDDWLHRGSLLGHPVLSIVSL